MAGVGQNPHYSREGHWVHSRRKQDGLDDTHILDSLAVAARTLAQAEISENLRKSQEYTRKISEKWAREKWAGRMTKKLKYILIYFCKVVLDLPSRLNTLVAILFHAEGSATRILDFQKNLGKSRESQISEIFPSFTRFFRVSLDTNYYVLEWFSEAESAPIRSAVKF